MNYDDCGKWIYFFGKFWNEPVLSMLGALSFELLGDEENYTKFSRDSVQAEFRIRNFQNAKKKYTVYILSRATDG
jgi:hypothetical protein